MNERTDWLFCPLCNWSTALPNKMQRHLEKKHSSRVDVRAVEEALLVVNPRSGAVTVDEEE